MVVLSACLMEAALLETHTSGGGGSGTDTAPRSSFQSSSSPSPGGLCRQLRPGTAITELVRNLKDSQRPQARSRRGAARRDPGAGPEARRWSSGSLGGSCGAPHPTPPHPTPAPAAQLPTAPGWRRGSVGRGLGAGTAGGWIAGGPSGGGGGQVEGGAVIPPGGEAASIF